MGEGDKGAVPAALKDLQQGVGAGVPHLADEVDKDAQLLPLADQVLQLLDGQALLPGGVIAQRDGPGKTVAALLLLLPDQAGAVGPAHVSEVDAELLDRLLIGVLEQVVEHVVVGTAVVVEKLLDHGKDHVLEAVVGELLSQIHHPSGCPLRVLLHLADALGDRGLDHRFFHQVRVQLPLLAASQRQIFLS